MVYVEALKSPFLTQNYVGEIIPVPSASSRLNMREVQLLRQKHGPLAFSGTCVQQSQTSLAFCKLTVKKLLRKHIRRHES